MTGPHPHPRLPDDDDEQQVPAPVDARSQDLRRTKVQKHYTAPVVAYSNIPMVAWNYKIIISYICLI